MEFDLSQLIAWGKTIIAAVLALIAAITAGPSILNAVKSKLSTVPTLSGEASANSDRLPPEDFKTHAQTIVTAATYADGDTKLKYLLEGLTEAETLKAEVTRMGELKTPASSKELKS